jgi:multiple sugar transport system permease protein
METLTPDTALPNKPRAGGLNRWRTWRINPGRARATWQQIGLLLVLGLAALLMLIPFAWMLATSLSRAANSSMPRVPRLWPPDASLFNYRVALTNLPILRYYANSAFVTIITTLGYLFTSSLAGYAFAKGRFPGKTPLFILLLTTMMIPFEIRMIPLYLFMRSLHLDNTRAALILPFMAGGFGIFLMRQYMTAIPDDLVDAARVDGASEITIFLSIILPLSGPALAALAIFNALWRWNDLLWPLLVISSPDLYTITYGLATITRNQGAYTGVALASTALAVVPLLILYLLLQRFIIRGIMLSGLKG